MSITRSFPSLSIAAIVAAAVLSACGSDGSDLYTAPPAEAATTDTAGEPPHETSHETSDTTSDVAAGTATVDPTGIAATIEVKALDNTFIEEKVDVAVGTEVVWKNGGRNDHDIVPVAEGEAWGVGIEAFHPGESYSHVFTEPGEYRYYCTIHGTADVGMTGTIVVG